MKRFSLLALALVIAAGTSACSATDSVSPKASVKKDITCRSGYVVAEYADGTQYCKLAD